MQNERQTDSPYARFESTDLILRDELAIDRTLLANERTLLAYLRSAVTLVIAGISIIHFSHAVWFDIVGIACIPAGILSAIVGICRFRKMNTAVSLVRKQILSQSAEARAAARATTPLSTDRSG